MELERAAGTYPACVQASYLDITHDYNGFWLPSGGLQGSTARVSGQAKAQTASAGAHAHDGSTTTAAPAPEGPNWVVIGGFLAVMALVVFGAALTKPRAAGGSSGGLPPLTGEA